MTSTLSKPATTMLDSSNGSAATNRPTPVAWAVRDIAPFALSLIPFALAIGSASASAELTGAEASGSAVFILAGGAQLAAIELLAGGAGAVGVLATVALINLRLMLYGAGIGRWFSDAPRWQRVACAAFAIDQNYFVTEQRIDDLPGLSDRRRYFATATCCLVLAFLSCQLVGYQIGAVVPSTLGLHLAAPLLFAGMLAKTVVGHRQLVTAGVAAAVLVGTSGIVGGAALPLATVAALVVGTRTRS